jgi:poly-gamma-glutamate capsule biosynthesis protein CapA/YwtB (metallophosphatase superfamily)
VPTVITGAKEMVRDLAKMRLKAVPFALRNALNTAAFETRNIWQNEIRKTFVNRNKFTVGSIRVEQASTAKLVATVGSIADFMATQEDGGTVKGKSGHIKAVPTAAAAGQGRGTRTKTVRGRFYLGAIQVAHPSLSGGRRQRNAIALAVARKQGKKLVMLTRPSGAKGLFLISGGKRKLKARLIWDMSRTSVHVDAQPTLERSVDAVKPKLDHMLQAAVQQQMQRIGVR